MSVKSIGISFGIGVALQSSFGSAFKTIDEKGRALSKSLKSISFQKGLTGKVLGLNRELQQLQKAQKRAGGGSDELKNKIKTTKKAFLEAKLEARKYGIELKNASKMQRAFSKLEKIQSQVGVSLANSQQRKGTRDNLKGQMLDKLAIGYAIAAPFKAGIEFESSMARVKALSGATNEEFKRLNSTARQLGASTTFSASEVGQGMQYLAMAGFKANETIKAMPGLLNLASAGQTDLAMTSDIASDILSGFGLKAKDMGNVSDILAKTFTTANTDLAQLGETMKYVGPVARKAGMSLEEASAMAGLLGNVGIKGSQAGTTLRKMLLSLAAPSSGASKTLKKLGVDTLDANGNMRNMVEILGDVAKATKGMGSGEQLAIYKDIFGEEAAAGVAELISKEGAKGITKYLDVIKNYKGTASRIAKQQNDTVKGSFKALGSALEGVSISATSLFLPALKGITSGITSVTQGLNSFIENHRTLATVIGGVGGGMIALSVSAFALRYAFSFVADGFGSLYRGFKLAVFWTSAEGRALAIAKVQMYLTTVKAKALAFWEGVVATKTKIVTLWTSRYAIAQKAGAIASGVFRVAMMGVNFVLSANPIGLVVTAIGALVGGLIWAYNKFDWFKGGVDKVWGFVKTIFKWSPLGLLMDSFGKAFDWLSSKFEWFGKSVSKLKSIGSAIKSFFGFGGDEKDQKKDKSANNPNFNPGATMKKVAVATAVSTQLVASQPQYTLPVQKIQKEKPSIQQIYHVKVIVNNPSSSIDIEKAIKRAMLQQGTDRNLSDEVI